ncbi:DUF1631 family protein [Simiduia aestuariiviva]|uniref:DUF1631 family protein n=1 Tax=Simiduia aestuariiviva TaxID=1510459 RepID=A0A839UIG0_9GAMM|nr:DUF1631 family protein [Simiduia aestuariiviva]MBB3167642.1 hypothetical protein [Simiduia aestuariiviva]
MARFELEAMFAGDVGQLAKLWATLAKIHGLTVVEYRAAMADQLFAPLLCPHGLDARCRQLIQPLHADFMQALANNEALVVQHDHWLWQFARWLHEYGVLWRPDSDKTSRESESLVVSLCECAPTALAQAESDAASQCIAHVTQLLQLGERKQARAALLTERLCESELSDMRLHSAKCQVVALLNKHLAGRPFPIALVKPLQEVLQGELQHLILTHGDARYKVATFWTLWEKMLPVLGQCFSCDVDSDQAGADQQLYSRIPPLLDQLEQSLAIATADPAAYEQWVESLNEHLMAAIKKEDLACEPLAPLAVAAAASSATITPSLVEQLSAFKEGSWFLFEREDEGVRPYQMALNRPDLQQVLFVDAFGRKAFAQNKSECAACLATGVGRQLNRQTPSDILRRWLEPCVAQANAALNKARQAAHQAAKDELEARRLSAHKAMAEARALNEAKAQQDRDEQLAQAAARTKARTENAQQAEAQVAALQVGAWLLEHKDESEQRIKLSVILSGVGKYIFVDELNRKHAETTRAELIDRFAVGELSLLHQGNNFEDQLAKVIRGLRRTSA